MGLSYLKRNGGSYNIPHNNNIHLEIEQYSNEWIWNNSDALSLYNKINIGNNSNPFFFHFLCWNSFLVFKISCAIKLIDHSVKWQKFAYWQIFAQVKSVWYSIDGTLLAEGVREAFRGSKWLIFHWRIFSRSFKLCRNTLPIPVAIFDNSAALFCQTIANVNELLQYTLSDS